MEGKRTGLNDYPKRSTVSDNGLMFMLMPGGRAAVVPMQIPDEPQTSASPQISGAEETPNAIVLPLSPAALPSDASATVTGTSGSPPDTTTQLPPTTSSVDESATSIGSTDQSIPSSTLSETTTSILAGVSTDGAFALSSSDMVTTSSLQLSLPTTVSSEDVVNTKAPVYAGIILGIIAGVACVTALFAWWVRIRSHAKRRHLYGDTDVPWAPSENGDSGMEEARNMTQTRSNLESIGLGGREDLAQVEAWEPRGDRDVGEPRKSENYPNDSGPFMHSVYDPYSCHGAPGQHDSILSFIQPFQNGPYPRARALPSDIRSIDSASADDHSAASSLGPLRVANLLPGDQSAATSRAATALGMNNRTYSIGTDDLGDILRPEGETSRSTLDRRSPSAYSWTSLSALEATNKGSEQCRRPVTTPGPGRWTSFKSIFTVMASNLSIRGRSLNKGEDILTPIPSRRSIRTSDSGDIYPDGHRAAYSQPDTERNPRSATGGDENCGFTGLETFKPLAGRKSTKSGQLRRDLLSRNTGWDERYSSQDTPSRASSIYSNASATLAIGRQLDDMMISTSLSRNGTLELIHKRQGSKSEENLSVSRPAAITRVSSTGCSVASSQTADTDDTTQRALVDRRRRARRLDDWTEQEVNGAG